MRIVNLASRPFLNRRPVRRIAAALWVVGAILFVLVVWLYGEYLRGTAINRAKLAEIATEIEAEDEVAREVAARLLRLDLAERNDRVEFLNSLIEKRTFPWSRLFDDLEDVLLDEIYLQTVSPELEENDEDRRAARRRVVTPAEARERARRERRGEAAPEREERPQTREEPEYVSLGLLGIARTDEALLDFVDVLYAAERFHQPYLASEARETDGRQVRFDISVKYRLPRTPPPPDLSAATDRAAATTPLVTPDSPQTESADATPGPSADETQERPAVVVESRGVEGQTIDREEEQPARVERAKPSRRPAETPPPPAETPELSASPMRTRAMAPTRSGGERPPSQVLEPAPRSAPARRDEQTPPPADLAPELSEPAASAARSLRSGASGADAGRRPRP